MITKRKIEILYIIGRLAVGGTERQLLELVTRLDTERYNPKVCCLSEGGKLVENLKKNIKSYVIKRKSSFDISRLYRLYKLIKMEQPHIVHTFLFNANTYGRLAAKLAGVPIIISSERDLGFNLSQFDRIINRLLSKWSNKIVANSKSVADRVVKEDKINDDKVTYIYNGIDVQSFVTHVDSSQKKEQLGIPPENKVVTVVANMYYPIKGHSYFIHAASKIIRVMPDTTFILVGDGTLKESFIRLSKKLNVFKNMLFLGFRPDIPELLAITDIAVLPSLSEGFPNVVLEAMAAGKPVVASAVGGILEIVLNNETGFLIPPADSDALAEKIITLLQDEALCTVMGIAGYQRVAALFSIDQMVRNTECLYEALIRKKLFRRKG